MQHTTLLYKFLKNSSTIKNAHRLNAVCKATNSVLNGGKLSVTSIGRHITGRAKVKNKIKMADRLLSNGTLLSEQPGIYRYLANYLIGSKQTLLTLIDWSPIGEHLYHVLKASVYSQGRSLTIYQELHEEKYLGNRKIQEKFLSKLKSFFPDKHLIIITDAGFKTDFFKQVLALGWDFVGRVRSNMKYQFIDKPDWLNCTDLYTKATHKVQSIGKVLLAKSNRLPCSLYLYKENIPELKRPRKIKNKTQDAIYSKRMTDPWLIASSLNIKEQDNQKVILAYKKRMRIEHEFRDIKNPDWGAGLNCSRSRCKTRLAILLLIGHLALLLLWLIGLIAEKNNWHYDFQANSIKKKRIISLVFLGLQLIKHDYMKRITNIDMNTVIEQNKIFYDQIF